MANILDWLQSLPELGLIAGTGLIALVESVVGIGAFMPGQGAMLIAAAAVDSVPVFLLLWAVATVGGIVGNVIGFELGRRFGPALRETKLIKRYAAGGWDKATALLHKHGRWAVFIGRIVPFGAVSGTVPVVAGAAHMPYRKFLPPVAAGAACLTGAILLTGVGIATSLKNVSNIALIAIIGVLLALVATVVILKRRKNAKARRTTADTAPGGQDQDPEFEPTR